MTADGEPDVPGERGDGSTDETRGAWLTGKQVDRARTLVELADSAAMTAVGLVFTLPQGSDRRGLTIRLQGLQARLADRVRDLVLTEQRETTAVPVPPDATEGEALNAWRDALVARYEGTGGEQ